MDDLILRPFNHVISGRRECDNERLLSMEPCVRSQRSHQAGHDPGTARSAGQRITYWATGAPLPSASSLLAISSWCWSSSSRATSSAALYWTLILELMPRQGWGPIYTLSWEKILGIITNFYPHPIWCNLNWPPKAVQYIPTDSCES